MEIHETPMCQPCLPTKLRGFESLANQAIPHEAGHIVVGVALGLPTRGLEVEVYRDGGELRVGDFATLSKEPIDGAIAMMPPWMLKTYKLTIAGGLAGMSLPVCRPKTLASGVTARG